MNMLFAMRDMDAVSLDTLQPLRKPGNHIAAAKTQEQFLQAIDAAFDIIAVHTGLFHDVYPWEWLHTLRQKQPGARIILALDDSVYDSFLLECIVRQAAYYGYAVIDVGHTADEVLSEWLAFASASDGTQPVSLRTKDTERTGGRVIAVWPAASKDGATTVAVNTALALAAGSKLKVGLVDANLRNPEIRSSLNLAGTGPNHFRLRSKLQTQSLRAEELAAACASYRNMPRLHIMPGSPRRDTASDMTPEMVAHLLDVCRQAFDITIMDLNAFPDNAATVCAVRGADHRWLVCQNNYASYKTSWGEWYECYWKYCGVTPSDISLILNRTAQADKPERIAEQLGMTLRAAIPNVGGGLGLRSVHEGVPLYFQDNAALFIDAIGQLAAGIAGKDRMMAADETAALQRKSGWLSRLTGLFA